jgi:hypothetical protein
MEAREPPWPGGPPSAFPSKLPVRDPRRRQLAAHALEVRRRPDVQEAHVDAIRPQETTGTFYGGSGRGSPAGADAVFVVIRTARSRLRQDHGGTGMPPSGSRASCRRGGSHLSILGGRLIILSDGGDAARLESLSPTDGSPESRGHAGRPEYLSKPVARTRHPRRPTSDRATESAIGILNRSLLTEDVLARRAGKHSFLSYLLDGIKEEHMKGSTPSIARRSRTRDRRGAQRLVTFHANPPERASHTGVVPGPGDQRLGR